MSFVSRSLHAPLKWPNVQGLHHIKMRLGQTNTNNTKWKVIVGTGTNIILYKVPGNRRLIVLRFLFRFLFLYLALRLCSSWKWRSFLRLVNGGHICNSLHTDLSFGGHSLSLPGWWLRLPSWLWLWAWRFLASTGQRCSPCLYNLILVFQCCGDRLVSKVRSVERRCIHCTCCCCWRRNCRCHFRCVCQWWWFRCCY